MKKRKIKFKSDKNFKFKFPKKLILLGQKFNLEFAKLADEDRCYGRINLHTNTIQFNKKLKKHPEILENVLFHELGHYFAVYYNLETSEIFSDAFSRFVTSILDQAGYKQK